MNMITRTAVVAFTALSLVACASGPVLAPAGDFNAGSYSVPLKQDWTAMKVKTGKGKSAQLLTMDGLSLNSVYLFSDMEEGDSFMKERKKESPVPKYSVDMSELELVEFVTESLERGGGLVNIEATNIEPATFKGEDAIRFDFSAVNEDGLNQSGSSILGTVDDKLNIVLYMAPSIYYYGKLKGEVEAMFDSVED